MPVKHSTKKSSMKKSSVKKSTKNGTKSKMPPGHGYCLKCRKYSKIVSSTLRKTKNNRSQQISVGECGHKMYAFVKG
jgi:hypothetical protein